MTGISTEQKGEVVLYAKFSLEYDGMFKAIISKRTKNSLTVEWSRLPEADGYKIYSAHCFTGMKFYKEVTDPQETTLVREGLKEGHYYKFRIKAYKLVNGKKKKIGKTNTVHATTSNNAIYSVSKTPEIISIGGKSIEPVTRTSLEMAVGQKTRVKIREVSEEDNKTVQDHHGFHFFSNDKNVAKVSKGGRIKARSKGECRIYCFAQNGYFAIVDLTVK